MTAICLAATLALFFVSTPPSLSLSLSLPPTAVFCHYPLGTYTYKHITYPPPLSIPPNDRLPSELCLPFDD